MNIHMYSVTQYYNLGDLQIQNPFEKVFERRPTFIVTVGHMFGIGRLVTWMCAVVNVGSMNS